MQTDTQLLLLLEDSFHLPGATIQHRALTIDPKASDTDLIHLLKRITLVDGFAQWASASVIAELLARKGESWLNEFTEENGIHPKKRRELLAVHTFYPASARTAPLSYEHYRDAMHAVSDGKPKALERATAYLKAATDAGWLVSEMRKRTRKAEAINPPVQAEADLTSYAAVHEFARYSKQHLPHLSSWSAERIALVLTDLGEAAHFIDTLRSLAQLKSVRAITSRKG